MKHSYKKNFKQGSPDMRRLKLLYKISHCSRVFMITLLLLLVLVFIQTFALEIYRTFYVYNKKSSYQVQQSEKEPLDRQQRVSRSERLFLPDGTVHLMYRDRQLPENERALIYDTNDSLIWQGNEDELPDSYLKWPDTPRRYLSTYSLSGYQAIYPDSRRSILVPVLNGRDIESLWRYESSGGYFAGFDKDGNRIGYCGSSGFVQEKSQTKPLEQPGNFIAWMPIEGSGPVILWGSKNSLYQIDFRNQTVELLSQLPDKKISRIEVNGWMKLASDSELYVDNEKYRPLIVCTTEDNSFTVILRDPAETMQINLPEESKARISDVTATKEKIYMRAFDSSMFPPKEITKNQKALMKWYQERRKKPIENSEQLYQVDSAGNLTLLNKFEWTSDLRQTTSKEHDLQEKFRKTLTKASPAFYDLFNRYFFRLYVRNLYDTNRNIYEFLSFFIHFAPSYNPFSYILSLLMAGFVFFHAWPRRKSMAGLIGWIVFAALFNIVGLLVYLALNYTPTIQCHNCNKRRGLNTPQCPHCGADLPLAAAPDKLSIITGT